MSKPNLKSLAPTTKNRENIMTYSYNRYETEAAIRILCEAYPNCFFEDPHLRRPLDNCIISDLEKDGALEDYDLLVHAVKFYQNNFGYRYKILAGAGKINLDGKEVGIVTESEFLRTQKGIKEDKAKLRERNEANPITTARVYQSRQIPDDQLKKIDALPMMKAPMKIAPKVIEAAAPAVVPAKPTVAEAAQSKLAEMLKQHTRKPKAVKKILTVNIPESLMLKIDGWAAQNDVTRSDAARMLLELAMTVAEQGGMGL